MVQVVVQGVSSCSAEMQRELRGRRKYILICRSAVDRGTCAKVAGSACAAKMRLAAACAATCTAQGAARQRADLQEWCSRAA
eukprot:4442655-Alexandrium_andersonii.AAC.1